MDLKQNAKLDPSLGDQSNLQGPFTSSSNEPPRIFGNYASDGALIPPQFSGSVFEDDMSSFGMDYGGQDGSDHGDSKRRRIARACDLCRRRKIKCDGKSPCAHCLNYSTECVYHFEQKVRKPAKTAKYIEGLENRLGRMEHLLRLSGLLAEDEEGRTDLGALEARLAERVSSERGSPSGHSDRAHATSHREASPQATPGQSPPSRRSSSPKAAKVEDDIPGKATAAEVDDLAELMDSLVTNNQGETRYIGSSSGFSIFSPRGMEWVSQKTGDDRFRNMLNMLSADDNKWFHWKPEVFDDIFERQTFMALPEKEECFALVGDFFESFNNMLPLFHEPTFMHLLDKQYSDEPYEGSGWWASLNVVLAIAWRIQTIKGAVPINRQNSDWAYFKNALGVLPELTLRNTDLFSVQALLGMCFFLQGTPNPQPSFFLLGAATRLAHSIGLHKRGSGHGFNTLELEQRKRVFWIAYLCDKDMCIRSGRPPAQDESDWNVELPADEPEDGIGTIPMPDGSGKVNLFRKQCEFGVISSKVFTRLYSVKASKQSDGELLNTISELDAELEQWKESIPVCFRPDHEIDTTQPQLTIHLAVLHFAYYNCLTTIHRRSVLHGYWTSRLAQFAIEGRNTQALNHRVFSSAALCVSAARMSISLLKYIPAGDYAVVWLVLYYPVSALVTLFSNILQNPQDPRARPDLKLVNVVVNFLEQIAQEETGSLRRMFSICKELERIGRAVLDKAEKEMSTRQKRKQERDREKLEKTWTLRQQQQQQTTTTSSIYRREAFSQHNSNVQTNAPSSTSAGGHSTAPFIANPSSPQKQQMKGFPLPNAFNTFDPNQDFSPSQNQNSSPSGQNQAYSSLLADPTSLGPNSIGANDISNMSNNMPFFANLDMDIGASTVMNDVGGSFMPQDMWSMPMTFEGWDWADMTNMGGFGGGGGF